MCEKGLFARLGRAYSPAQLGVGGSALGAAPVRVIGVAVKVLRSVLVALLVSAILVLAPGTAHADPAVTSVSPSVGVNTGVTQLTEIKGTGFLPGAKIALVELQPGTGALEQTVVATNHGTVAANGTSITHVDLPTTGLAPSSKEPPSSPADVSWYVRVTNPDGKTSTSTEFNLIGETPSLTQPADGNTPKLPRGTTTTVTIQGANLARGATFTIDSGSAPTQPPQSDVDYRLSVVSATWKSLGSYELQIKVPKGANLGFRPLSVTNTDGKSSAVCAKCLEVVSAEKLRKPIVTAISPKNSTNSDANKALAVKITGEDLNDKGSITATLVGHCTTAGCPMAARRIPVAITTVRDADPAKQELNPLEQFIEGTVDVAMQSPGRYSLEVVNTAGPGGDQPTGSGTLVNSFEVVGSPPEVTAPNASTPVTLDAAASSPTAFSVTGRHFAHGDVVKIADATVSDVTVHDRERLTVTAKAQSGAPTARRDLVVEHANGSRFVCTGCVQIKAAALPRPPDSATDRYIDAVHQLFLSRSATSSEKTRWRPSVDRGDRLALTRELSTSDAFAGKQINLLYRSILGRPADAGGRAYWLGQVRRGLRLDQIASYFYGGPEFFKMSGSTNGGFVDRLYRQILGRTADESGRRYWIDQIESGRLDRSGVAANFYAGIESRRQRASRQYVLVMGVAPSHAVREQLAGRIGSVGDLVVAAELAASRAYYDKVTAT